MTGGPMNAERLLEVYEQISEAPDAIARLRRFVLDLAVRGKLVEQDAGDEPASELVRRVADDRASSAKRQKALPEIDLRAIGPIPKNWAAVPLIALGNWAIGSGFPKAEQGKSDGPHFFLKVSDMNLPENEKYITVANNLIDDEAASRMKAIIHPSGTIIFPKIGGAIATNKRRILTRGSAIDNNCLGITFSTHIASEWAYLLLTSLDFTLYQAGTAVPALQQAKLAEIPVLLPPLAEQHRIVAKVDELMALCDRLEEARKTREEVRDKLTAASLARLTAPDTTAEDFPTHAAFALEALPALTTRPDQIKSLRQTILNLAVRGKLVEQDPADEPGSSLLSRIHEQKKDDVQPQEMRRAEKFSVEENEFPYEVPQNWAWAALRQLSYNLGDGLHGTPAYATDGQIYFVNGTNLREGRIQIFENTKRVSKEEWQKHAKPLSERSMLVSINGTLTNYAFYNGEKVLLGKSACYFELSPLVDMEFIRLIVQSPYYIDYAMTSATGTTIKNLSLKAMNSLPVPIPPLVEQHRIVAKVDALMALCDRLEAALTEADTTRTRLLEALLHEALASATDTLEAAE